MEKLLDNLGDLGKQVAGNVMGKQGSNGSKVRSKDIIKNISSSVMDKTERLKTLDQDLRGTLKDLHNRYRVESLVELTASELVRYCDLATQLGYTNRRLESAYKELVNWSQFDQATKQRYETEIDDIRKEGAQVPDRLGQLQAELIQYKDEFNRHKMEAAKMAEELSEWKETNRILRQANTDMNSRHMSEKQDLLNKYNGDLRISQSRFEEQVEGLHSQVNQLKRQVANESQTRQESLAKVQRECQEDKMALSQTHNRLIEKTRLQHNAELWQWSENENSLKRSHNEERGRWQDKLSKEQAGHERTIEDKQKEHQDLVRNLENVHAKQKEKLRDEYERNMNEQRTKHDDTRMKLLSKIGELEESLTTQASQLVATHSGEMENMKTTHSTEIARLKGSHRTEVDKLSARVAGLSGELTAQATKLKEAHIQELSTATKHYEAKIARLRSDHKEETDKMNAEIAGNKNRYAMSIEELKKAQAVKLEEWRLASAKDVSRLKQQQAEEIARLERRHTEEKGQLRKDRDSLSAALRAREKFEGMKDVDIKSRFQALMLDVENIARLEWNSSQAKTIVRPPPQQMRQILQDTIWVLLHERIFCSPFRIFGEAGKVLEKQWNNAHGSDREFDIGGYVWPRPSIPAERWRYMSIQECHEALKGAPSELDPRAKYKVGYITAMAELNDKLKSALGAVIEIDQTNNKAIERMTRKAAMLWIEMEKERCRIVVFVQQPQAHSIKDRVSRLRERNLELVVNPELKTYGNSQGSDLQVEKEIFESDISVWSPNQ